MDLNTPSRRWPAREAGQSCPFGRQATLGWRAVPGCFSEPQVQLTRLIDLTDLEWPALTITDKRTVDRGRPARSRNSTRWPCPPEWLSAPLIDQCCHAFFLALLQDLEDRDRRRQISACRCRPAR